MEVKAWSYEEIPEFTDEVEGAVWVDTTGDEPQVDYLPDVAYATYGDRTLRLQILKPRTRNNPTPRSLPCFVYVQGSAWRKQNIYHDIPQLARMAALGYVAALVEYRGSNEATFPCPIVDAHNAVRFLRFHAAEYGIDPSRIVLAGNSSGGHTAVYASFWQGEEENLYPGISAEVSCVIDYYGSVSVMADDSNPTTVDHNLPTSPEGLEMGGVNLRERPDLMRLLSVECNIDEATPVPPVLILHGTKDRTVNTTCSVALYQRLRAYGKETELYLLRGADHGNAEFWTDEVNTIVDRFIRRHFA